MDFSMLTAFLLLAVGLALIIAEVFLPSGGVISFLAALALGGAMVSAWNVWGVAAPGRFWAFLGTTVVLIPVTAGGALWWLSRSRFGNRLFLNPPEPEEVRPNRTDSLREKLLGQTGRAVTMMVPGGIVLVNGERLNAMAEGVMLEAGDPIKVVRVEGNRIVVRARTAAELAAEAKSSEPVAAAGNSTPAAQPSAAVPVNPTSRPAGGVDTERASNVSEPPIDGEAAVEAETDSTPGRMNGAHEDSAAKPGAPVRTSSEPPLDFEIPGG